jgi:hypothetical protein
MNAAKNKEFAEYMKQARKRLDEGEIATTREIKKIYNRVAKQIAEEIKKATPGTLRYAHLEHLHRTLNVAAEQLNKNVLKAITKGIHVAARAATGAAQRTFSEMEQDLWRRAEIAQMFSTINERAVMALLARTGPDGLKLSDRVWRTSQKARDALKVIVEDGVTRGLDARKMARQAQQYLQPGVWTPLKEETRKRLGVPKDVSMEAMRLAVTEINNAFHEGTRMAWNAVPSVQGYYWRLSHTHEIIDICDDYAAYNGDGFWSKDRVPTKPHPWCRCYIVPAVEDTDVFVERLQDWLYDPELQPDIEEWYNDVREFLPRPPKGIKRVLPQALRQKEDEIAYLAYERAYVFDRKGKIFFKKDGEKSQVTFTTEERESFRGKNLVFTHNHPSVGGSFSWEDVGFAAVNDLSEMRAVGREYVHSIKKPATGWPDINVLYTHYNLAEEEVKAEFWRKIDAGEMTRTEAAKEHYHEVWSRVARRLNLPYRREVRKGAGN